jgi:nucleoside-diphosphate-sugar epimerase
MGVFPDVSIALADGNDPERHLRGPCSIDRAREDFGFVPRFSLEDGVADWIRVGGRADGKIGKH